jgi:hypothetical protein
MGQREQSRETVGGLIFIRHLDGSRSIQPAIHRDRWQRFDFASYHVHLGYGLSMSAAQAVWGQYLQLCPQTGDLVAGPRHPEYSENV